MVMQTNAFAILAKLPCVRTSDVRALPAIPAVYIAARHDGRILYVGKTRNLAQRWQNHHRAAQLITADTYILWIAVDPAMPDRGLSIVERHCIRFFQPELNYAPMERTPRQDTRPFADRQRQRVVAIERLIADCEKTQTEIAATEDAMLQQTEQLARWLRTYRQGLADVLARRKEQTERLRIKTTTVRRDAERFLPSLRLLKKDAA